MKIKRWAVWSNGAQKYDTKKFISRDRAIKRRDSIVQSQLDNLAIDNLYDRFKMSQKIKADLVVVSVKERWSE